MTTPPEDAPEHGPPPPPVPRSRGGRRCDCPYCAGRHPAPPSPGRRRFRLEATVPAGQVVGLDRDTVHRRLGALVPGYSAGIGRAGELTLRFTVRARARAEAERVAGQLLRYVLPTAAHAVSAVRVLDPVVVRVPAPRPAPDSGGPVLPRPEPAV